MHDVYVFGDSHWRVFFPFVNHGDAAANVSHTQDGIRTIDTIANELSGATMYGLLNPNSRNGARNRILSTLDRLGGVDHVGLVFGEVDARFHNGRYFIGDQISLGRIYDLVSRYARFITDDLMIPKRVRKKVFVYTGFNYPNAGETLLQPSQPMGDESYLRASMVNERVKSALFSLNIPNLHIIHENNPIVSDDGVHLVPEMIYPTVLRKMKMVLDIPHYPPGELPL